MLSIRIVAAGAVAAIAVVLAVGGATAQTATSEQAGKPLSLLAGLRPPHQAKTHEAKTHETKTHEAKAIVHAKAADRAVKKTASRKPSANAAIRLASRKHNKVAARQSEEPPAQIERPVQTTASAPPPNSWPVADTTLPVTDAMPVADSATAASRSAAPDSGLTPSALVVNGQTVQVTSPDQVNEMDLADDNNNAAASHVAFAAPVQEDASQNASRVGSASWIAQVLAALGGAVAAGSVAWFLIGFGPVRTYG
jgi:hypothetical protein